MLLYVESRHYKVVYFSRCMNIDLFNLNLFFLNGIPKQWLIFKCSDGFTYVHSVNYNYLTGV